MGRPDEFTPSQQPRASVPTGDIRSGAGAGRSPRGAVPVRSFVTLVPKGRAPPSGGVRTGNRPTEPLAGLADRPCTKRKLNTPLLWTFVNRRHRLRGSPARIPLFHHSAFSARKRLLSPALPHASVPRQGGAQRGPPAGEAGRPRSASAGRPSIIPLTTGQI